ncbi:MAG: hypothetical protein AUF67_05715 [Acidobacteria bacterium 13_1_20CM_58_21]|nr:MAG: hypothetical protein AUF67_05715 [Acidobacteria bacterium 13_1_20CM_58_21]
MFSFWPLSFSSGSGIGAGFQQSGNIVLLRNSESGVNCLPRPRRDSKNWRAPTIRIDPELRGNAGWAGFDGDFLAFLRKGSLLE